jgi:hypothetical protein
MADFRNNPAVTVRGLRNNNPFNMVKTSIAWQGKVIGNDPRFETFATVEHGIRAGIIDIVGDMAKKGQNTLTKLFEAFAPRFENDTTAYINYVSQVSGIAPNAPLLTNNQIDAGSLAKIVQGIINKENGTEAAKVITPQILLSGVNMAVNSSAIKKYIANPRQFSTTSVNERLNDYSGLVFMLLILIIVLYQLIK